jgi:hypothetical protein
MKAKITDCFELRAGTNGLKHAPGLVLVFDASGVESAIPKAGSRVHLLQPGGGDLELVIGEVKRHGRARSFFFEGLQRGDAPVGSVLSWSVNQRCPNPPPIIANTSTRARWRASPRSTCAPASSSKAS